MSLVTVLYCKSVVVTSTSLVSHAHITSGYRLHSDWTTHPVKHLDTPSYLFVLFVVGFFYNFTFYLQTEDIKYMKQHIWNYVVKSYILKSTKYYSTKQRATTLRMSV
ncbi:hypothetical protein NQD34_003942 [Periophthalmus magnuspinnatus]|nr:hypothetical protein NQD34_003942 [Periophthalmus magnuspinnatus]